MVLAKKKSLLWGKKNENLGFDDDIYCCRNNNLLHTFRNYRLESYPSGAREINESNNWNNFVSHWQYKGADDCKN